MDGKGKKFFNTGSMVLMGVMASIIWILSFTPLGYMKIGVVEISFLALPVAICACYTGKWGGMIAGAMFGISSFIQCFGYSAFGVAMMSVNPFYCFIICFVSRILMGFLAGLLADLLTKYMKRKHLRSAIVCLSTALLNTLLFCGALAMCFGRIPLTIGDTEINVIKAVIIPAVSLNGLVEAAATCIVGTPVCMALSSARMALKKIK